MPNPSGAAKFFAVAGALAAVAGLAGPASGAPSAPGPAPAADQMTLGEAAPAPLGYLHFCARRPDQCGIATDAAAGTDALSEAGANALVAKYYWSIAFADQGSPDLRLSPRSGDFRAAAPAPAGRVGAYDW